MINLKKIYNNTDTIIGKLDRLRTGEDINLCSSFCVMQFLELIIVIRNLFPRCFTRIRLHSHSELRYMVTDFSKYRQTRHLLEHVRLRVHGLYLAKVMLFEVPKIELIT